MSKKESIQEWWTKSNLRKTAFKNFEVKCFVYLDHIIPHRCFHKFYWSILESRILFLRLFFNSITSTITFFIATGKFWYSEVIYPTALTRQWCCRGLYRILNVLVDILRIQKQPPEVIFLKKLSLKISQYLHEKDLCMSLLRPATLLKSDYNTELFLRILHNF